MDQVNTGGPLTGSVSWSIDRASMVYKVVHGPGTQGGMVHGPGSMFCIRL